MKKTKVFDEWEDISESHKLAELDGIQRGIKQERERILKIINKPFKGVPEINEWRKELKKEIRN